MKKLFANIGLVSVLASCSKSSEEGLEITSPTPVTLYSSDTSQITTNKESVTFTSNSDYVATVSQTGLITGKRVGNTTIDVSDGKGHASVAVTVNPKNTSFVEPVLDFGISSADVIKKEGQSPLTEVSNGLLFDSKGKETYRMYGFENDKLKSSCLIVKTTLAETITDFLIERYAVVDANSGFGFGDGSYIALFVNSLDFDKVTMGVGISAYNYSTLMVLYFKTSTTKAERESMTKEYIEMYKQMIQ